MQRRIIVLVVLMAGMLLPAIAHSQTSTSTPESPPPGLTIRVVQRGETLYRIAQEYGLTIAELAEINGILDVNNLVVGQRLLVPSPQATATPITHTIQPGETLNSIAITYGVTLSALMQQNNILNADRIYAGQQLTIIPVRAEAEATPSITATPQPTATPTMTEVTISDATPTLAFVTADTAEAQPAISSTPILIIIDGAPPANNVNSAISEPVMTATPAPTMTATPQPVFTNANIHTVAQGETLFRIAQRYGLTTDELAEVNSLADPTRIYAGQQLIIPTSQRAAIELNFPQPITQLQVRPLVFVEGQTSSITLTTSVAATISGRFLDRDLPFFAQDDSTTHSAIIGIPVFTTPDIYAVDLRITTQQGTQIDYTFNVRIANGGYGTQNINIDRTELLAPAVEEFEIDLLTTLTSRINPTRYYNGSLSLPAANAMNSPFGTRRSYNDGPVNRYHNGADFASPIGAPIFAAADGVVVMSDTLNIRGEAIAIDHGWGIFTTYSHLTDRFVTVGETVTSGQTIGTAGSSGRITGPHLHWEVWVNGVAVDPMQWTREAFP